MKNSRRRRRRRRSRSRLILLKPYEKQATAQSKKKGKKDTHLSPKFPQTTPPSGSTILTLPNQNPLIRSPAIMTATATATRTRHRLLRQHLVRKPRLNARSAELMLAAQFNDVLAPKFFVADGALIVAYDCTCGCSSCCCGAERSGCYVSRCRWH